VNTVAQINSSRLKSLRRICLRHHASTSDAITGDRECCAPAYSRGGIIPNAQRPSSTQFTGRIWVAPRSEVQAEMNAFALNRAARPASTCIR